MVEQVVRFVALLSTGLAAGIALCILLTQRIWRPTPRFYTELMQLWIPALTIPAPGLGVSGLAAVAIDSVLMFNRGMRLAFSFAILALLLNVAALLLTKLGHFPINDQILTWDPASPPADWAYVRSRWSALHAGRTTCAVASFALLLVSNLVRP